MVDLSLGRANFSGVVEQRIESAWRVCSDLFGSAVGSELTASAERLRDELMFCLLGGFGVSYELNRSVYHRIRIVAPFDGSWTDGALQERLIEELSKQQFEPAKSDGQPRRYRYPLRKADLLVRARRWLLAHDDLFIRLEALESERERRCVLCQCPGIGPKTSSWILRNSGLATSLAILDVHVMRVLEAVGRLSDARLPRDYERAEDAFLMWCEELDAFPPAFDLFLWEWARGSLGAGS